MRTEEIEKYLSHRMTAEESAVFEQEMAVSPKLRDDVKMVAWTIAAIREVGHEQDQERIRRMKSAMPGDHKRMVSSVAATLIVGIMVAATISVPIIKHVTKSAPSPEQPVIEQPRQPAPIDPQPKDTLVLPMSPKPVTIDAPDNNASEQTRKDTEKKNEEKRKVTKEKIQTENNPAKTTEEMQKAVMANTVLDRWSDSNSVLYEIMRIERRNDGTVFVHVTITNHGYDRELHFENVTLNTDKLQRTAKWIKPVTAFKDTPVRAIFEFDFADLQNASVVYNFYLEEINARNGHNFKNLRE